MYVNYFSIKLEKIKAVIKKKKDSWAWRIKVFHNQYLTLTIRWHSHKESTCQCRRHKRLDLIPEWGRFPWSKKRQPTPVFLPGKFHEQRSLVGYSPWGCMESVTKRWTLLSIHATQSTTSTLT